MKLIDVTGKRFGRWLVIRRETGKGWVCRCDCGTEKILKHFFGSRSCGCLNREGIIDRSTKHGRTGTPEHNSWLAMRQRCYYKRHKDYHRYGGRGITVCAAWRARDGFPAFFTHVGEKPSPRHTLDRINTEGNYEPGNVRWADPLLQSINSSRTIKADLDGRVVSLRQAAKEAGANYDAVRHATQHSRHPETPAAACKRLSKRT